MMDHIIEIRAMVLPPDGVHITDPEFSTLCHTSRLITAQGLCYSLNIIHIKVFGSNKTVWYKSC